MSSSLRDFVFANEFSLLYYKSQDLIRLNQGFNLFKGYYRMVYINVHFM